MNIQSMEYIVALSKMLNFTKASAAMCTTQPTFSRVISSAEEDLGIVVFERSKRYVRLTPAGEILVSHFEKLLELYAEGVQNAKTASVRYSGRIIIGYIPDTINEDIALLVRCLSQKRADIKTTLQEVRYYELQSQLLSGALDVAVYTGIQTGFPSELEHYPLYESPLCAIVGDSHRLAGREEIYPAELRDETFVVLEHDATMSGAWSFVHRFAAAHGFIPRISEQASMQSSVMLQVSCGKGIGIASKLTASLAPENVRLIPIRDSEKCLRCAVWSRERENPALTVFIECLKTQFT